MIKSLQEEKARAAAAKAAEEEEWLHRLDPHRLPSHVAIIMDGNGRWAEKRGWPRAMGHHAGAETVRQIIEAASSLGLRFLTLYTFSAENWRRPPEEVNALMELIEHKLQDEINDMDRGNIRLEVLGRWHSLSASLREEIRRDMARTCNNGGLRLLLALNYGGRAEIVDAARALAEQVQAGQLDPADFTEELLARHLYAPDVPDPELLIRTGGEMRLSNFLLWQSAYTELWITPILWPDFTKADLYRALYEFQQRDRRFGGL